MTMQGPNPYAELADLVDRAGQLAHSLETVSVELTERCEGVFGWGANAACLDLAERVSAFVASMDAVLARASDEPTPEDVAKLGRYVESAASILRTSSAVVAEVGLAAFVGDVLALADDVAADARALAAALPGALRGVGWALAGLAAAITAGTLAVVVVRARR